MRNTEDRKPNDLFVLTDDQRFDTIRTPGNPEIMEPIRAIHRPDSFPPATGRPGFLGALPDLSVGRMNYVIQEMVSMGLNNFLDIG